MIGDVINAHSGWEVLFGNPRHSGVDIEVESKSYKLWQFGGLIYNAEIPHREIFAKQRQTSEAIVFDPRFLAHFLSDVITPSSIHFSAILEQDSEFLENARQTYLALRSELMPVDGQRALAESLCVDLLEKVPHNFKAKLNQFRLSSNELLLKEILCEIHSRVFEEELDLDRISERLGVTKFHIIRTMKRATGRAPFHYARSLRICQAARLLSTTKKNVLDIAIGCGFSEISAFNKAFKQFHGQTPSEYRNLLS